MTSTIASLKRASAACHAATDFAPARRGMFALVERRQGRAVEYKDRNEAVTAIKAAAGIAT